MKIKGRKFILNKTVLKAAFWLALTNLTCALSNKMTTAGNAVILQFTMPVFVILILLVFYKKKPSGEELLTCGLVFGGIVLFFLDSISAGNMLGDAIAVLSGVGYAFYFVLGSKDDASPLSSLVIAYGFCVLIGVPQVLKTDFSTATLGILLALLAFALLQQTAGQICLSEGLPGTDTVDASLISGIEPILNPIWVAVFWHEMLTPLALAGAAVVLVSITVYNYRCAKRLAAQQN